MALMNSRIKKYYDIAKIKLYPICRSLTGNGTRETLKIIKKYFPKLKIFKERSGKKFLTGIYHLNGIFKMHM